MVSLEVCVVGSMVVFCVAVVILTPSKQTYNFESNRHAVRNGWRKLGNNSSKDEVNPLHFFLLLYAAVGLRDDRGHCCYV
jgi:hypothetical protein